MGATKPDSCSRKLSPRRKSLATEQISTTDQPPTTDPASSTEQVHKLIFIRDVELTGDIPTLQTKDNRGITRILSAARCFNEKIVNPKDQKLQYKTPHLAHIGSDIWIPLEMLCINEQQVLMRSNHLTSKMRGIAKTHGTRDGQADLKRAGADFVDRFSLMMFDSVSIRLCCWRFY